MHSDGRPPDLGEPAATSGGGSRPIVQGWGKSQLAGVDVSSTGLDIMYNSNWAYSRVNETVCQRAEDQHHDRPFVSTFVHKRCQDVRDTASEPLRKLGGTA